MNVALAQLFAAIGLAFGATAFTTFSVRSERFTRLVAWSFIASLIAIFAALRWAVLPIDVTLWLGTTGLALGVLFSVGLKLAHKVDRKAEVQRATGGHLRRV